MGKPRGRNGREHMSQSVGNERVSIEAWERARWTVTSVMVTDEIRGNERINGDRGRSDIEGKAAREAASKCGQRASFNRAVGTSEIDGQGRRGD